MTLIAACGAEPQSGGKTTATTSFAISGGDFSGNSVRICGSRTPPADGKFRCENSLSPADAGPDACPCFNFTADGNLIDPTTGQANAVIRNLCPSVDPSADGSAGADWTFTFSIFTSPNCMGTQLNEPSNNFTCFDSRDLATQSNPNESVEMLNPGLNQNHIICTTVNASKTFNFLSCAQSCDVDVPDGSVCPVNRFSCGCTPTGGTCACDDDGGLTAANLPAGCQFELSTCDIICTP
jgi:hypothetical protein